MTMEKSLRHVPMHQPKHVCMNRLSRSPVSEQGYQKTSKTHRQRLPVSPIDYDSRLGNEALMSEPLTKM